jgi:galactokinase
MEDRGRASRIQVRGTGSGIGGIGLTVEGARDVYALCQTRVNYFVPSETPAEGLGVMLLFRLINEAVPDFFRPDRRIHIARAPGRLDVMGGFADYSGSLVLQLPTAEAACAAVQKRDDDMLRVWSPSRDGSRTQLLSVRLGDLGLPDAPIDYAEARAFLLADPRDRWVAYLLGCLIVLARERGLRPQFGFDLLVSSDVPEGKGVSSSAAIEVATMQALAVLYGIPLQGRELALLCQMVENEVVGAPCGVMDQMTAACGQADELMALRCQPCELEGSLVVPPELEIVGLDSGVRHAVSGSDYGAVRTGAFLGARWLADLRGLPIRAEGSLRIADDPVWKGYLANCPVEEFRSRYAAQLPDSIGGAEFLARFGGIADALSPVDPARTYAVLAPTRHPIEENARVERFRELITAPLSPASREELGALMDASHVSYSACGLGNAATDFLVEQVRARQAAGAPVYGGKITGGGSGGTVVMIGERGKVWYEALRIKKALHLETGHSGHVFRWSSPGAMSFGSIELSPVHG